MQFCDMEQIPFSDSAMWNRFQKGILLHVSYSIIRFPYMEFTMIVFCLGSPQIRCSEAAKRGQTMGEAQGAAQGGEGWHGGGVGEEKLHVTEVLCLRSSTP